MLQQHGHGLTCGLIETKPKGGSLLIIRTGINTDATIVTHRIIPFRHGVDLHRTTADTGVATAALKLYLSHLKPSAPLKQRQKAAGRTEQSTPVFKKEKF